MPTQVRLFQFSAVLIIKWRTQAFMRLHLHYNQLHNIRLIMSLIIAAVEGALSITKLLSSRDFVFSWSVTVLIL